MIRIQIAVNSQLYLYIFLFFSLIILLAYLITTDSNHKKQPFADVQNRRS